MSEDLITRLSSDLQPVPRQAMSMRLLVGLGIGAVFATVLMLAWLGARADLATAVGTPIFWGKFAFATVLTAIGFAAAQRLARPGGRLRQPIRAFAVVLAGTAIAGIVQLLSSAPAEYRDLVIGGSALLCPFYIIALSAPVFVACVLVMRRLAPTNLPAAGFAAGLLAGAAGAWVYAFHCGESGLPFITIWYTSGILAVALLGAAAGRWLLRW